MKRRDFVSVTTSAGLAAGPSAAAGPPAASASSIFELRYFHLRNGSQVQRTTDFLGKYFLPAAQRAGVGPMGFFAAVIAEQSPFAMALTSYATLNAMAEAMDKIASDKEFQKGFEEYNSMSELSYIRMENSLLRGFDTWPNVVTPGARQPTRIFELRTYESNNLKAGRRKIKMFDDGEAAIFKRMGMSPVFFGETIVGRNLPNLTYMLAFDNLAAREALWGKFGSDPEWQKLRSNPDLADALIVSNISNAILRPLPFSPIR
jgi:hypothetical protein